MTTHSVELEYDKLMRSWTPRCSCGWVGQEEKSKLGAWGRVHRPGGHLDVYSARTDLEAIEEKWLQQCGSCDAGLPMACTHPTEDYRSVILALVNEVKMLRWIVQASPASHDWLVHGILAQNDRRGKCARCQRPFDALDPSATGRAAYRDSPYCRACISRCHESTDFAHSCVICKEPADEPAFPPISDQFPY